MLQMLSETVDCLHYQDSYDDSEHDNSYTTVAIVTVDQDHGDDSWTTTSPDPATAHGSILYKLSHEYFRVREAKIYLILFFVWLVFQFPRNDEPLCFFAFLFVFSYSDWSVSLSHLLSIYYVQIVTSNKLYLNRNQQILSLLFTQHWTLLWSTIDTT